MNKKIYAKIEAEKTIGQIIQIDEARIRDHLGEMVRGTESAKDSLHYR